MRAIRGLPIHMSGVWRFSSRPPASPFLKPDTATSEGIHYCFADKRATGTFVCLRSLVGGPCITRHRHARRALLRYDFAVRSESNGCSAHSFPTPPSRGPFHVAEQSYTSRACPSLTGSATRREKGPTPKAWEVSARAALRLVSHSKIAAAGEREARGGSCYTQPLDEHAIWQSETRRKGGSWGAGRASPVPRHVYCLFHNSHHFCCFYYYFALLLAFG